MRDEPDGTSTAGHGPVTRWLLAGDPAVRWQVLRDLLGAPAEAVAAERSRVGAEGLGARLLALQGPDGTWGGAAWNPGWDSTMHVLMLLRDLGVDPAGEKVRCALDLVRQRVTWRGAGPPEVADHGFFDGEVEPCINGQVAAVGAYFGQDVNRLVERRLLGEQLADGGWNCEAEVGSTRSSFNTTVCVLEALLAWEVAGAGGSDVTESRRRGEEYLLERRLLRRRSTGELIARDRKQGSDWSRLAFPTWWHYDVLRALDHLRRASATPDDRAAEAVDIVAAKRDPQGRWPLEVRHTGRLPVDLGEEPGHPSRWVTLRALRVLHWAASG